MDRDLSGTFRTRYPALGATHVNPESDPDAWFQIRPARISAGDHKSMIQMYDSQIPWLRSIGAGSMWSSKVGSDPQKEKSWHDMISACDDECSDGGYTASFGPDWTRAFVAELHVLSHKDHHVDYLRDVLGHTKVMPIVRDPKRDISEVIVPVAAIVLDGTAPPGTLEIIQTQDSPEPFVFLTLLLSDRRVERVAKGAGAALLRYVREELLPQLNGVKRFAGDCYAGNDARLVKYYENQGFNVIGQWVYKKKDGDWPRAVFEMRL